MAPAMTVTAAATDRVMTRRILLAATVRERTAPPSHCGYRPASHMASRNHYDRNWPAATVAAGAQLLRTPCCTAAELVFSTKESPPGPPARWPGDTLWA
jgi:hypothetical protein